MKKVIRLTESDLTRIVRRVIKESQASVYCIGINDMGRIKLQNNQTGKFTFGNDNKITILTSTGSELGKLEKPETFNKDVFDARIKSGIKKDAKVNYIWTAEDSTGSTGDICFYLKPI